MTPPTDPRGAPPSPSVESALAETSVDLEALLRDVRRLWGEPICGAVEAGQDRHEVYTDVDQSMPAVCCCGEADLLDRIDAAIAALARRSTGQRAPTGPTKQPSKESAMSDSEKGRGLWRKSGIPGGKYLVQRRDGSVPEWPHFVIGGKDPAAGAALRAYADEAQRLGFDPKYVSDVRELADEFDNYVANEGAGDPDGRPHRKDDPATIAKMNPDGSA